MKLWEFIADGNDKLEHRDAASLLCLGATATMLLRYFIADVVIEESLFITVLAYVGGNAAMKQAMKTPKKGAKKDEPLGKGD